MKPRILLVDDDENVLSGYKRQLRTHFDVKTALGGEEGIAAQKSDGPFWVVVADMGMPGMNGIQFLTAFKEIAPDTVRMMLTGNTDLQTAMNAVNEGSIFRFLTKPCPSEVLTKSLDDGVRQYRLITAEHELLQKTLTGGVKVLTEILSFVNPTAFSCTSRVRHYVRHLVEYLQIPDAWQFELAAMLCQIGCISLSSEILKKIYAHEPVSKEERIMFQNHPEIARKLLERIPRLETIACMVENQTKPYNAFTPVEEVTQQSTIALGAQMLKVAIDFDRLVTQGTPPKSALLHMLTQNGEYNQEMLEALGKFQTEDIDRQAITKTIGIAELKAGMIVDEDIKAKNGLLLVAKGQEVTYPVLLRLENFAKGAGIKEPFRVTMIAQDLLDEKA